MTNRKSDEDQKDNNKNEGKLGRNYNVDNNADEEEEDEDEDDDGKSNDEDEMTRSDQVSSVEGGGEAGGTEHFLPVLVVPAVGYQQWAIGYQ